ncbi:DUF262 domain-containing protein [Burkholderia vietnamiensis]|uniref:DUF262 domain-containing protein n=1 Tax=Burkholderia vietnamiensis TaxID=60552 RepID=UPI001CF4342F|nr:DUF262 domain-containing protein [Burkholderia vietnamiensis]MCA7984118.1 DUF262 domain-containing protein [Burkholderia vietnamiensis]
MSYYPKTISEVVSEFVNRTTFLPAMQREYVWDTDGIEKLFDSLMGDFPIGVFLFWKIREENKNQWAAYEFIRDFDQENPHNKEANLNGINQDIYLVLDGQQRLTSLFLGLKGSYRYFYYKWHKTKLYLNLLKVPEKGDNPEELTYEFKFRADSEPDPRDPSPQHWYLVGDILNFDDAEDAKKNIKAQLASFSEDQRDNANTLIGRLHSKIHTARLLNYYEEKSQDYDKVVEVFIRTNTGGKKLEYSDILLSTATAKWRHLNAREELHSFTDEINTTGGGYSFGKDFVLKACLYLTEGLPIQYKVKNFNRANLEKIEDNWENITECIGATINLISKFGYSDKNLVSKIALLPVALYISLSGNKNFVSSTNVVDVTNQVHIQKWLAVALLKNSFGGSSDTTLKNLQEVFESIPDLTAFPHEALSKRLGIEPSFSKTEIENLLGINYCTKYSYLTLSLLYPDRDWKDNVYHEDHIFPKSEFTEAKLRHRGYDDAKIKSYLQSYNSLANLQLLTASENLEKNATPFGEWLPSKDANFKARHRIPEIASYDFDDFLEFIEKRSKLIEERLEKVSF